ncbi:MAG: hypothetical protein H6733_15515 [Alphaproteobacteria bacterium]|nr:hypothetical protein [Alphaproteobacteria bacterium]
MPTLSLLTLLVAPALAVEPRLPATSEVAPAVYIDITREGFAQADEIITSVLPPTVPIDNSGFIQGGSFGGGFAGLDYEFGVDNLVVIPELDSASVIPIGPTVCREGAGTPGNGYLDVDAGLLVSLNTAANPAHAWLEADMNLFFGLIDVGLLNERCNIHIDRKLVSVGVDVTIGPKQNPSTCFYNYVEPASCPLALDARGQCGCIIPEITIDNFTWDMDIQNIDDLGLQCSGFIELLIDLADFFGIDPVELLLESLRPTIDSTINGAIADLQPQLDALGDALLIQQDIDLLGNNLSIGICPTDWYVDNDGMRIELSGHAHGPEFPNPCIAAYDEGGSLVTVPPSGERYPQLGNSGVAFDEHAAAQINDDFGNQALYHLWRTGLLCQTLSPDQSAIDLPITLDTSLLNLLSGQALTDLFPEAQPITLVTRPRKPPVMRTIPSGPNLAVVTLEDMGIDMYASLDGRLSRVVGMELSADATLDVAFDSSIGQIGAQVGIDPALIDPVVVFNDLAPDASASIEDGFGGVIQQLVGPLLGDALGDIVFDLPSIQGLGVQEAVLAPSGPGQDWLGVFGDIGPVAYGSTGAAGCDLFGGDPSGSGGCDTGCSSNPLPSRLGLLFLPLLVAVFRRRR